MYDGRLRVDPKTMPCDSGTSFGWHRHVCSECKTEWAHDGIVVLNVSVKEGKKAHTCPVCHREEWWCAVIGPDVPICAGFEGFFEEEE